MAWSVHFMGKPEAIKRALRAYTNNLSADDRATFNKARPVLEGLLDLNHGDPNMTLSLNASGNGSDEDAKSGTVSVVLMQSNAMMVQ